MQKPKVAKTAFKILTGVIIGSAVGSILGLTLAPQKGSEMRKVLRERSKEIFQKGREKITNTKEMGFFKKTLIKMLTPKK